MSIKARLATSVLGLSALGLVAITAHEGYTDKAIIPVPGDVPTYGFGSTTRPDGSPVRMGDTITPPKALERAMADITRYEGAIKRCIFTPLTQDEYDVYVSFAYNVGETAFCSSTLVRKVNAGDYEGGCNELLRWVYAGGSRVQGLVNRREKERKQCLGLS